jgi:hypothetical protein
MDSSAVEQSVRTPFGLGLIKSVRADGIVVVELVNGTGAGFLGYFHTQALEVDAGEVPQTGDQAPMVVTPAQDDPQALGFRKLHFHEFGPPSKRYRPEHPAHGFLFAFS